MTTLADIRAMVAIGAERARQDAKWGEQNHPDVDPVLTSREGGVTPQRMAEEYGIPTAVAARAATDTAAERGQCTWAHILIEEMAEAVAAATTEGVERTTEEVLQTTAVGVGWLGAIERRKPRRKRIYLSGPISGDPHARERFSAEASRLVGMGWDVVNPFDIDPVNHPGEPCPPGYHPGDDAVEHTSSACFMRTDLLALLSCDDICMLPGWARSRGATVEHAVAVACGMTIYGANA